jgi:hypothetical protein
MQRDGIILIIFTVVWTAIAGFLVWAIGPVALYDSAFDSVNAFLLRAVPAAFVATWWILSVRMIVKSAANRRGKRIIQGTVVEHSQKEYSIYIEDTLHTYTLYYLAIDDGTRDQVEGWEVPVEAWNLFPLGTNAEALIAGDGRYPYYLAHL